MAIKIVKRGVVLITQSAMKGGPTISAVLSRVEAERLKKRFGGVIVPVVGMKYRMAQKTLRVLSDDAERAIVLAAAQKGL